MPNPQLLEYLKAQRAAGFSFEELREAIIAQGWPESEADESIMQVRAAPPQGSQSDEVQLDLDAKGEIFWKGGPQPTKDSATQDNVANVPHQVDAPSGFQFETPSWAKSSSSSTSAHQENFASSSFDIGPEPDKEEIATPNQDESLSDIDAAPTFSDFEPPKMPWETSELQATPMLTEGRQSQSSQFPADEDPVTQVPKMPWDLQETHDADAPSKIPAEPDAIDHFDIPPLPELDLLPADTEIPPEQPAAEPGHAPLILDKDASYNPQTAFKQEIEAVPPFPGTTRLSPSQQPQVMSPVSPRSAAPVFGTPMQEMPAAPLQAGHQGRVIFLAIMTILGGIINMALSVGVFLEIALLTENVEIFANYSQAISIATLVLGAILIVTGIGLWLCRKWAWRISIILNILYCAFVIPIVLLILLLRPSTRAAFH